MFIYVLAGWAALIIICEIYMLIRVKDSDGESSQKDDDSVELARLHAGYANRANHSKRRAIRVAYIAVPALVALFIFVSLVMQGISM